MKVRILTIGYKGRFTQGQEADAKVLPEGHVYDYAVTLGTTTRSSRWWPFNQYKTPLVLNFHAHELELIDASSATESQAIHAAPEPLSVKAA